MATQDEGTALSPEEQALFEAMGGDAAKEADEAESAKETAKDAGKEAAKEAAKEKAKPADEKVVPLAALHEAREQNKALKAEMLALKDVVSKGDAKLQKFISAITDKGTKEAPKFEDDPAGNLKAANEKLEAEIAEVRKRVEAGDNANAQTQNLAKFSSFVQAKEAAFAKDHTDYFKASAFVAEAWRAEFEEAGFDEDKIPQLVFHKAIGVTNQAAQKGKDPALAIYNIAAKFGYKADEAKAEGNGEDKPKGNGEEKLKTLEKGQAAARKIDSGAGPDTLTLSSLAQMSDDQIDELVRDDKWWGKEIRRSPL